MVLTKNIFLITLQIGDGNAQPKELPEFDIIWSTNQQISMYGQYLAKQVLVGYTNNLVEEAEPIVAIPENVFLRKIFVKEKCRTIEIAKRDQADLSIWCDRYKLDKEETGAAVAWKQATMWLT